MAAICEYKKYNLNVEDYAHQKFALLPNNKRKFDDMENKENISTAQSILEQALKNKQPEQPAAKRRQIKRMFRPWEDVNCNKQTNKSDTPTITELPKRIAPVQVLSTIHSNVITYPNTTHQYGSKPRTEKEQQKRNRNTVPYLISRRNKQAEQFMLQQQYIAQQQQYMAQQHYMAHRHYQQAAMMEQSMRASMYLRHLQQIALQRQQQLFVFGQQY